MKNFFLLSRAFILLFVIVTSCKKEVRYNSLDEKTDIGVTINTNPLLMSLDNSTINSTNGPGMEYDSTGEMRILQESLPESFFKSLDTGRILTVDLDTSGLLRKITSFSVDKKELVIQTDQAEMGDIFLNADFTLSTEAMPNTKLKGSLSNEEISKALTDKNGIIHPVRITYQTPYGTFHKNAMSNEDFCTADFETNFVDTCVNEKNIKIWITAYLKASSSFIMDFEYRMGSVEMKQWGLIWKPVYHPGQLEYFGTYYRGFIETSATVHLKATYKAESDKVKKLKNDLFKISYKFLVGPAPVFIDISCDIYGRLKCSFEGKANASSGFMTNAEVKLGVEYENDSFAPIYEFNSNKTFNPLSIDGAISAKVRTELYPQFMVSFYSAGGPTFELVPYLTAEANASASYILGENAFDAAWDASIDFGVDARIGAKLEIAGKTLKKYNSGNIKIVSPINIWHVPESIEIKQGDNQQGNANQLLAYPIVVVVKDSWKNPFPGIPVVFSIIKGDGSLNKKLKFSDFYGTVENYWKLGSLGVNNCQATIKKADSTIVDSVIFSSRATK
jgi:hypothetical protein